TRWCPAPGHTPPSNSARPPMTLTRLLISNARGTVLVAVAAGLVGGLASAGLIALIQAALAAQAPAGAGLVGAFAALCGVALVTKVVSQSLLIRLGQSAFHDLYLRLSRRVLAVPLRA